MGIEIKTGKVKEKDALVELGELRVEDPPVFGQYGSRLLQIFVVVKHAIGEGLRVFGDTLCVKLAHFLGEHAGVTRWRGDGQRGVRGIDVYRRHIQLEARMGLLQVEATYSLHAGEKREQLEFHLDPVTPFALAQNKFLS